MFLINVLAWTALILSYLASYTNPNSIGWIAYFGLGYPIIVLGNLLLVVFWMIKKHRLAYSGLLLLLLGFNHHRHFLQLSSTDEAGEHAIKVMSYNVRLFDLYNWTHNWETKNEILSLIASHDPDVICFQEFFKDPADPNFRTTDTLQQILNTTYFFEGYTHKLKEQRFGLVTFSKFPIVGTGQVKFDNSPSNNCIYTDILHGEDTVRIYNAHLGSIGFQYADYDFIGSDGFPKWPSEPAGEQRILSKLKVGFQTRAIQVDSLLAHIHGNPYETILCCDLNDTPISYSYERLSDELCDAFMQAGNGVGGTYIGNFPFLRIDYVLHSNGWETVDFETVDNELSDHRPVVAVIQPVD